MNIVFMGTPDFAVPCLKKLIEAGHNVIVIDDFSNSKPEVLDYIKELTGKEVKFYEFNVLDKEKMEEVFSSNDIDSIIHCAAFKAVGESMIKPIEYYTNNYISCCKNDEKI